MPAMVMQHDVDPKEVIYKNVGMKKLGVIPGFELMANRVLLGLYNRPEKTKSNIILTDQRRAEERYQGKAALVLVVGPTAFVDDDHFQFHGQNVEPGDWVSLSVTDGRAVMVNGQDCRIIRDQDIGMKIPAPDVIY